MNSQSHCAVDITVKLIVMVMKQPGGQRLALSRLRWQMLYGARLIRLHERGWTAEHVIRKNRAKSRWPARLAIRLSGLIGIVRASIKGVR